MGWRDARRQEGVRARNRTFNEVFTFAQRPIADRCNISGLLLPRSSEVPMEQFIERHNIAHYKDLLKEETDAAKRAVLLNLLVEEEAKQASHAGPQHKALPHTPRRLPIA
jgi:hypothetical protein